MTKQVDELMRLADEYAYANTEDQERSNREALRTALEAALKPGSEPIAYLYHDARIPNDAHPWLHSTLLVLAADRRQGLPGETPLYTAPPAQTPPPRLTDEQIGNIHYIESECREQPSPMAFARAIESAVRKQFGVNDE